MQITIGAISSQFVKKQLSLSLLGRRLIYKGSHDTSL
jgi:hypothetical protein